MLISAAVTSGPADLLQARQDVATELCWVLTHGEVPELLHHRDPGAGNRLRGPERILRRAGEIVLAGEQVQRTRACVDRPHLRAQIAFHPVEIQVTLEHAWTALFVHPESFMACHFGALRSDQARDKRRAHLSAVYIGAVQPDGVIPRILEVRRLEADQCSEHGGVLDSKVEYDSAPDGTAHHDRTLEIERSAERDNHVRVPGGGEAVLFPLPTLGWERLSVPRHIEREHPVMTRHLL